MKQRSSPRKTVLSIAVIVVALVILLALIVRQRLDSDNIAGTQIAQLNLSQTAAAVPTSTLTITMTPSQTATATTPPTLTPTPNLTLTSIATYQPSPNPSFSVTAQTFAGVQRVYVPAGYFLMGDSFGLGFDDEVPVHPVYTNEFWLDAYLVTNEQFAQCPEVICERPTKVSSHKRDDYFVNPAYKDFPVIHITWMQAVKYCEWRNGRLPTEAEFEKAAGWNPQTGKMSIYPWGNESLDSNRANYNRLDGDTSTVGDYSGGVSAIGAYDMSGNVWEWTADWYIPYSERVVTPTTPITGTKKVVRGGSWHTASQGDSESQTKELLYLRVANRGSQSPDEAINETGFRCAYDH